MATTKVLTLSQSAKVTGKTKPTILKAITSNRVIANKNPKGEWEVDIASLSQSYKFVENFEEKVNGVSSNQLTEVTTKVNGDLTHEIIELKAKNKVMEERLEDKDTIIRDLKNDKDYLKEQVTKSNEIIGKQTMLITHQPDTTTTESTKQKTSTWLVFLLIIALILIAVMLIQPEKLAPLWEYLALFQ